MAKNHLIGLLLGTEEDWPSAFEAMIRRYNPTIEHDGQSHTFSTERVTNEPFDLRMVPRHSIVIDRLAHWYSLSREWLKKVALMDDVYLLNNPFTFQAMEKHAAYCAMIRLGLKVPETWMIPHKSPPENPRFPYTSRKYNQSFDLQEVAGRVGYPLFMKPFDGGAWVGVTKIDNPEELVAHYDESGERLMHLQKAVDGFDVFARSLSIGAETMVMHFNPERPMYDRYQVSHDFLEPEIGAEVVAIGKLVNAFFRWEFNSCETLVKGPEVFPIDYANAAPDVSLTSLHYYFPWAIKTLVKWTIFCTATHRKMRVNQDIATYTRIADDDSLSYDQKVKEYGKLAEAYFQTEEYEAFCSKNLGEIDEVMLEFVGSDEFDRILIDTVLETFPQHEHEKFIAHYRGLLSAWADDQR
ncbi:MAG: ATP-grasp domain-containing protein [Actinomycetota bacterium]